MLHQFRRNAFSSHKATNSLVLLQFGSARLNQRHDYCGIKSDRSFFYFKDIYGYCQSTAKHWPHEMKHLPLFRQAFAQSHIRHEDTKASNRGYPYWVSPYRCFAVSPCLPDFCGAVIPCVIMRYGCLDDLSISPMIAGNIMVGFVAAAAIHLNAVARRCRAASQRTAVQNNVLRRSSPVHSASQMASALQTPHLASGVSSSPARQRIPPVKAVSSCPTSNVSPTPSDNANVQ